jgi:hypothetical protein
MSFDYESAATELKLYLDNDRELYLGQRQSIIDNLLKKKNAGKYDKEKAKKLWEYLAESGAKKYTKEFGAGAGPWHVQWPPVIRRTTARELRDEFDAQYSHGEFEDRQRELETKAQRDKRTAVAAGKRAASVSRHKKKKKKVTKRRAVKKNPKPPHQVKTIRELTMLVNTASPLVLAGMTGRAYYFRDGLGHDHFFEHGGSELTKSAFLKQWQRSGGIAVGKPEAGTGTATVTKRRESPMAGSGVKYKPGRLLGWLNEYAEDKPKPVGRTKKRRSTSRSSSGCTKADAEKVFKRDIMPVILESEQRVEFRGERSVTRAGPPDRPMRREMWNNFVDGLQKDGVITREQAYSWSHPSWLETWGAGRSRR